MKWFMETETAPTWMDFLWHAGEMVEIKSAAGDRPRPVAGTARGMANLRRRSKRERMARPPLQWASGRATRQV